MSDFKRSIKFNCISAITIALFSILSLLSVENGRAAPISTVNTSKVIMKTKHLHANWEPNLVVLKVSNQVQNFYIDPLKSDQVSGRQDSKPIPVSFFFDGHDFPLAALWIKLEQEASEAILRRCRIPGSPTTVARGKLLNFDGQKWPSPILWFKISKYPSLLNEHNDREHVIAEIERAFRIWEDVTNLTFTRRNTGEVDIEIRFEKGYHADGYTAFDGPGKTLAHTSTYIKDGTARKICYSQIDFDDEEDWRIKSIYYVAVHEVGHALGLDHSRVSGSAMWYAYTGNQANFKLHWDDILAIQALYGKRPITFSDVLVWIWETTLSCIFMIVIVITYSSHLFK